MQAAEANVRAGQQLLAAGQAESGRGWLARAVRMLTRQRQWERAMALLEQHPELAKVRLFVIVMRWQRAVALLEQHPELAGCTSLLCSLSSPCITVPVARQILQQGGLDVDAHALPALPQCCMRVGCNP